MRKRWKGERGSTDNHPMSAAALVLFAFQGDAITAPPADVTWPAAIEAERPLALEQPYRLFVQHNCASTDPTGVFTTSHPWLSVKR